MGAPLLEAPGRFHGAQRSRLGLLLALLAVLAVPLAIVAVLKGAAAVDGAQVLPPHGGGLAS